MTNTEIKSKLEKDIAALLKKYEANMGGEEIQADIYSMEDTDQGLEIVWNDEYMGYMLAGYVSSTVFDEMEEIFKACGLDMVDSDGNRGIFERL
jgi:predicted RNA-binding protein (virulence factor B family)